MTTLVFESFSRPSRCSVIEPPTIVIPCVRAQLAHGLDCLAILERLGGPAEGVGRADRVPLLGQEHQVGSGRGRPGNQALGFLDVVGLLRPGVQLDRGDAEAVGHARKDSLRPCRERLPRSSRRRARSPSSARRRSPTARVTASCATSSSRATGAFPVRPRGCDEVLGVPCVRSLAEIEEPIDLVDVFRPTGGLSRRSAGGGRRRRAEPVAPAGDRLVRGAPNRRRGRPRVRRGRVHEDRARSRSWPNGWGAPPPLPSGGGRGST